MKNDEAYGIALPPELLEEFQACTERNGMLEHARRLIYEEETFGNHEHRLYKLYDGMTWGCKCQNISISIEKRVRYSILERSSSYVFFFFYLVNRHGTAMGRNGHGLDRPSRREMLRERALSSPSR